MAKAVKRKHKKQAKKREIVVYKAKNILEEDRINKGGRPEVITKEVVNEILSRIAGGESLKQIVESSDKMPAQSSWFLWLSKDDGETEPYAGLSEKYTHACRARTDFLAERSMELAEEAVNDIVGDDKSDSARVQARKLQIDAIHWYASKVNPKKYGDKLDVTSDNKPIQQNQITLVNFADKKKDEDVIDIKDDESEG